jgi:hypothetical protein
MTDQLEVLEQLIPRIAQARNVAQFGEAFHEAHEHAQGLIPGIERMERWQLSIQLLSGYWEADDKNEALSALRSLQSAGQKIETAQDLNQLSQVRATATGAKLGIDAVVRDGLRVWQRRINADIGSLGSLGDLLSALEDTRELGRRMTSIALRGALLLSQFPPTADQVESHRALMEDARTIRKDLAAIGAGESVEAFLNALAKNEATLALADDAVLKWIRDRHSDSLFRISLERIASH